MITRVTFVDALSRAAASGTLLTRKHDPNNSGSALDSTRSVLSPEMSASLEAFVTGGLYAVNWYSDRNHPHGPGYFEVIPLPHSGFDVVGSTIPSGSISPSGSLDRLVFVSGSRQSWHVFAESREEIEAQVASRRFILLDSWR